jgi:hypothetical protein
VKNESGSLVEAKCGRPATFPIFSLLSLILSSSLSQPPHLGDTLENFWQHGLAARPPSLADRPPWLPYKRTAKGRLLLHPTSSQATLNFLNPSPSS